jgi:hypothetical protein
MNQGLPIPYTVCNRLQKAKATFKVTEGGGLKCNSWIKRVFLSGEAANWLLGRFDYDDEEITDVYFFVLYNEAIFGKFRPISFEGVPCIHTGYDTYVKLVPLPTGKHVCVHINSSSESCKPDDIPNIFRQFDRFFLYFIELTKPDNVRIFTKECECQYISESRVIGHSYPVIMKSIKTEDDCWLFCRCVAEIIEKMRKYFMKARRSHLECGLNFLIPKCSHCTSICQKTFEIWRNKTYRSGSKKYYECKKEFENLQSSSVV